MKITINAYTLDERPVRVTLDSTNERHVILNGREIDELASIHYTYQRLVDNALDDLYDGPIFHDGRIWAKHPTTTTVNAWEPAVLEEARHA